MSTQRQDDPRLSRRILTPTEREGLEKNLGRIATDKRGDLEGVPRRLRGAIYKSGEETTDAMDADERRIKRALSQGARDSLSAGERTQLESTAKQLKESLAKRMVSKKDMELRPGSVDFRRAVNRVAGQEMSQDFAKDASAYKNIMRQLHPDDPDASNLETIRPE